MNAEMKEYLKKKFILLEDVVRDPDNYDPVEIVEIIYDAILKLEALETTE